MGVRSPGQKWGAEDRQGQRAFPGRCPQPGVGESTPAPGWRPAGRGKGLREVKFAGRIGLGGLARRDRAGSHFHGWEQN